VRRVRGVKGVSDMIAVKPRAEPTEVRKKRQEALKRSAEAEANGVLVRDQWQRGVSEWHRALLARAPRSRTRGVVGIGRPRWKTGSSSPPDLRAGAEPAKLNSCDLDGGTLAQCKAPCTLLSCALVGDSPCARLLDCRASPTPMPAMVMAAADFTYTGSVYAEASGGKLQKRYTMVRARTRGKP
jgi:hypothetical protein